MSNADTFSVSTSAGELTVQFGWEGWVSVEMQGRSRQHAVVGNRRALERLLIQAGVSESEAQAHAKRLWKDRPRTGWRQGEADAWEAPWKRHPNGTLVMFLLGFAIIVIAIVGFKVDWVGV